MKQHPYSKMWWADYRLNKKMMGLSPASRCLVFELYMSTRYDGEEIVYLTPETIVSDHKYTKNEAQKCLEEIEKAGFLQVISENTFKVLELFKQNSISEKRSSAGRVGGKKTQQFASSKIHKANTQANGDYDCDYDSVSSNSSLTERGYRGETQTESSDCAVLGSPQPQSGTSGEVVTERSVAAPPRTEPAPDEAQTRTGTRKARGEAASANDEGFVEFWQAYPRHENKAGARKAWIKVTQKVPKGERMTPAEIMEAMRAQKERGWFNREMQFIPYPERYLSYRRWEDIPEAATTTQPVFHVPFAHDEPLVMEQDPIFAAMMQEDN